MTLKLCFMCDLHLPFDTNALQYDVLDWALENICREKPGCVLFAGDVTCDGNADVFRFFLQKMQSLDVPFLFIPGNSDLRCAESKDELQNISSPLENNIGGLRIFAVNDCTAEISDEQMAALEKADADSIVFMHHPNRERMLPWRAAHPETALFYGHYHISKVEGCDISLQAMDPDKAIGECPCLTYYDTETKELSKAYYDSPVPADYHEHFGISCYKPLEQIRFCIEHGLKNLELRPNCIQCDLQELEDAIAAWRENGGENLSIHLPDVEYRDGEVNANDIDWFMALANRLHADRFTQHVPRVPVGVVKSNPAVLGQICDYLAKKLEMVDHHMVIGVENMHMTAAEKADDARRFGYIPEECLAFMEELKARTHHHVGINFDIGHARNNMPFSQKYQISTWLSQVGKYAVGYHMHQVTQVNGKLSNHLAITHIYGILISYASFFKCWSTGRINKAPVIFEMRPEGAYEATLKTFEEFR